ncbi:sugar transferase [Microbacterium sp. NPDC096154]|uniref:sugar transferase n=1 Tax=Microbacterium sp. NPDC096154 TaxID=3155549 RepID=UPI00332A584E
MTGPQGAEAMEDLTLSDEAHPHTKRTRRSWTRRYAGRLVFTDVLVVAGTLLAYAYLAPFSLSQRVDWPHGPGLPYGVVLLILGLLWLIGLDAADSRDDHIVGHGIIEYRRIVNATLIVFCLVIAVAFLLRIDLARSLFLFAAPLGMLLLLFSRWLWRQWLRSRQRRAEYVHNVVVLGERTNALHIARMIRSTPDTGLNIIGAITKRGRQEPIDSDIPVVGSYDDALNAVERVGADTVIFAGADNIDPRALRQLGWEMGDRDIGWIVAPATTDVAGPRIHARPVAGLPLVHIDFPRLEGAKRFLKRSFDIVGSSLIILVASPVLLAVMIAIKLDGPGPLFYTQERIGRKGMPFRMIKFRSMVADADDQLASLLDVQGTSTQPLFKVTNDPRITRVGRFLRKHSLDELPQLFNVLMGDMSLVGPRPQRAAEVALYDEAAHRRLLVKPGMSGLWQVSGRSSLSWEDAIRLDLYYVENWSFTQDIVILFRTVKAVVAPGESAH